MKLDKIREAIGLFSSMAKCGERPTETSDNVVKEALTQIRQVENEIQSIPNLCPMGCDCGDLCPTICPNFKDC